MTEQDILMSNFFGRYNKQFECESMSDAVLTAVDYMFKLEASNIDYIEVFRGLDKWYLELVNLRIKAWKEGSVKTRSLLDIIEEKRALEYELALAAKLVYESEKMILREKKRIKTNGF